MNTFARGRLNEAKLSRDKVSRILGYDDVSGELYWKVNRTSNARAGSVAGYITDGYRRVKINGVLFSVHRVIWLLVHGVWPTDQIDHIDGNPLNNAIENLREVTNQENNRNRGLSRRNKSGFMGVVYARKTGKWWGHIKVDGRTILSPGYRRMESAIAWRRRMNRKYQFHQNHGRSTA